MQHTIIIPHRNREDHLRACLWSIRRSAEVTGVTDYEVLVLDDGDVIGGHVLANNLRYTSFGRSEEPFNKSKLLNIGIDNTYRSEFITFLDADAIVGPRWLECVPFAEKFARVCYRVRYVAQLPFIAAGSDHYRRILESFAFENYDDYALAWEAYDTPDHSPTGGAYQNGVHQSDFQDGPWQMKPTPGDPLVFGNSQFTIRRDVLGDLRFDETYIGRGFEDLDMIWRIWLAHPQTYRGVIWTDADHAMFHLTHEYEPEWSNPKLLDKNLQRYKARRREYRKQIKETNP